MTEKAKILGNAKVDDVRHTDYSGLTNVIEFQNGLTKREYFAGLALKGVTAFIPNDSQDEDYKIYARQAIKLADALLEELSKEVEDE